MQKLSPSVLRLVGDYARMHAPAFPSLGYRTAIPQALETTFVIREIIARTNASGAGLPQARQSLVRDPARQARR